MKTKKILIILFFVLICHASSIAQKRYYLKTDRPVKNILLQNKDTKKKTKLKPIYNKTIFILDENEFKNIVFIAREAVRIELLDNEKLLLTYIQLSENETINLNSLLCSLENPARELGEDIANGNFNLLDFVVSTKNTNFTTRGSGVDFAGSKSEICDINDLLISWVGGNTNEFRGEIFLNSDLIWEKEKLEQPNINYSIIQKDLYTSLQKGSTYLFQLTETSTGILHEFEFKYLPLVFENNGNFGCINEMKFNWRGSVIVNKVQIINPITKEVIWEKNIVENKNSIGADEIPKKLRKQLKLKSRYIFNIITEMKEFPMDFKISLSEEKYKELVNKN